MFDAVWIIWVTVGFFFVYVSFIGLFFWGFKHFKKRIQIEPPGSNVPDRPSKSNDDPPRV